jgi:alpha-glucosidase
MADFGYDVADYCDVDPLFGSLADLDALVADAHTRGLRVLLDFVPNHTSDRHPWFVDSRSGRTSARRDWYVWRDPAPGGGPPNNWTAALTEREPAWTLDRATGQYYLHCFLPAQPDLDWSNPAVEAAMHDVVRFWLARGIDGFRVDVTHCLGKDPALPDEPPEWTGIPHAALNDHESTHPILRRLRAVVDAFPGERMLVGEVFLAWHRAFHRYYGRGDELHLAFKLPDAVRVRWDAADWREYVAGLRAELAPVAGWPTFVLSNHDTPRHRTRFGGGEARARAAAVLLLTLPGTPFLYAGEELGLEDAVVPPDRVCDPGGRDGCRAPIPWAASPGHGWPVEPWLPFAADAGRRSVASLRGDPSSILHLYRRLLALRRASPALRAGGAVFLDAPDGVLAWARTADAERWEVVVNFTDAAVVCPARGVVALASDGAGEGSSMPATLDANRAVVLAAAG